MKHLLFGFLVVVSGAFSACSTHREDSSAAIRIRWERDPENLDPLVLPNENSLEAANMLYSSLLFVDPSRQQFTPCLAEALPTVEHTDSLTLLTYRIRPEAVWDNGQPILAKDVAFTLKVMNCPGLPIESNQAQWGFIRDIRFDPVDPRRFTLVCAGHSPEYQHSSGDYVILPEYPLDPQGQLRPISLASLRADTAADSHNPAVRAFVERYKQAQLAHHPEHLPGSGPYTLAKWEPGRFLTFKRKSHWWADTLRSDLLPLQAHPQQLDYQIIPDEATALLALRRGDIDVFPMMPAKEFQRLKQDPDNKAALQFFTADSYKMITACFNTRQPALQDKFTRQALAHLFDIPALIKATQLGMAYPSVGLINPNSGPVYNDSLPLPTYSPQTAMRLLRKAGWQRQPAGEWTRRSPDGTTQRLALTLSYRTGDPAFETIALQLRAAAGKLGIALQPQPLEASLFWEKLRAGSVDLYLFTITGNPFVYNFAPILHSNSIGSGNYTGFGNAASDQLIEAIASEENENRQTVLLRRFQRMLHEEKPLMVLFFLRSRLAASQRLTNLQVTGLRPGYTATAIQLAPSRTK
ncbi:ABC transporter substrate-binding protein [Hymenobacter chitinivorans]|uniref:Peptide/nickel transport system substrate-binding protein n=1 Tax=Hymenobacter chitinivorans DSM 11115 TaxID=1121954 RepID=A0A2M9BA73_9BACT|nr:ABC transporter substrate-binding protein [Hymenobacter chitinivorans]PJJ54835.1 peptide/nickel transport system substrate-binding protein [Hymenobacter chitinivorans DSM 11115]